MEKDELTLAVTSEGRLLFNLLLILSCFEEEYCSILSDLNIAELGVLFDGPFSTGGPLISGSHMRFLHQYVKFNPQIHSLILFEAVQEGGRHEQIFDIGADDAQKQKDLEGKLCGSLAASGATRNAFLNQRD